MTAHPAALPGRAMELCATGGTPWKKRAAECSLCRMGHCCIVYLFCHEVETTCINDPVQQSSVQPNMVQHNLSDDIPLRGTLPHGNNLEYREYFVTPAMFQPRAAQPSAMTWRQETKMT